MFDHFNSKEVQICYDVFCKWKHIDVKHLLNYMYIISQVNLAVHENYAATKITYKMQ